MVDISSLESRKLLFDREYSKHCENSTHKTNESTDASHDGDVFETIKGSFGYSSKDSNEVYSNFCKTYESSVYNNTYVDSYFRRISQVATQGLNACLALAKDDIQISSTPTSSKAVINIVMPRDHSVTVNSIAIDGDASCIDSGKKPGFGSRPTKYEDPFSITCNRNPARLPDGSGDLKKYDLTTIVIAFSNREFSEPYSVIMPAEGIPGPALRSEYQAKLKKYQAELDDLAAKYDKAKLTADLVPKLEARLASVDAKAIVWVRTSMAWVGHAPHTFTSKTYHGGCQASPDDKVEGRKWGNIPPYDFLCKKAYGADYSYTTFYKFSEDARPGECGLGLWLIACVKK